MKKMNERLIKLLRELEWAGDHGSCIICRRCANCQRPGHKETCETAIMLKDLGQEVEFKNNED